ncbi:hypothetical protein [Rhizobium sp. L18]|uniref:hypothetical protein n=1 Tax=Rhizobium sp. L18 TaxID=2035451 RepID=UPI000BE85633|nr:hypothetical protein [Rhizobium sp. L18]PDS87298.1 hypothetical protein CO654_02145 [Rhizobium sp. L18]
MSYIAATPEFGLIIRKAALIERKLSRQALLELMSGIDLIDENEGLLTFGPLFGVEAYQTIMRRLEIAGLAYVDDYFGLDILVPPWIKIGVSLAT